MSDTANRRAGGFAFQDLMFATMLIAVCSSLLIGHLALHYKRAHRERDRVFAFMTAKSILAEVYALSVSGQRVDHLDDGGHVSPTLSISEVTSAETDPMGNWKRAGDWVWWRELRVRGMPQAENHNLRRVTVTVLKQQPSGIRREVVSLASVVSIPAVGFPTTQVFDLYLVAIENIAGRGVAMESIRPFTEAVIAELERANPGLVLRTHWITKASYGRDADYAREVADTNPLPYALADRFNHGMRLPAERAFHAARVEKVRQRKAAITAAEEQGTAVPPDLLDMSEEPTWRLFLEDLNSHPEEYRHALILNMHGDVVPMPAMRNYSDAASDPVGLPGLRCVTHPEELRTRRDEDAAVFRIYAWSEDPDSTGGATVCPSQHAIALRVMGLDITDHRHVGRLAAQVRLENLYGGVPVTTVGTIAPDANYRPFARAKDIYQPRGTNEMFYFAQFVDPGAGEEKYTLIWLFHTAVISPAVRNTGASPENTWCEPAGETKVLPVAAPVTELPIVQAATGSKVVRDTNPSSGFIQGLDDGPASRLHGVEYIPCPTGEKSDFSHDLSAPGNGPKNTARWRLTIPCTVFGDRRFVNAAGEHHDPSADVCLTVRTGFWRVGESARKQSSEVSTTYTWWAASREAVPVTERAQFIGDPRHCPYKDVATGDPDFADGYNWFFDSLRKNGEDRTAGYPALDPERLRNSWLGGHRMDVPRYLALLREGLLRSRAVFGSVGSFGDARLLLGGEGRDGDSDFAAATETDKDRGRVSWSWQAFFNARSGRRALGIERVMRPGSLTEQGESLASEFHVAVPDVLFAVRRLAWVRQGPAPEWSKEPYASRRCDAWLMQSYCGPDDGGGSTLVELTARDGRARVLVNGIGGDLALRTRYSLLTLLHGYSSGGSGLLLRVELFLPTDAGELADPGNVRLEWDVSCGRWDGRPSAGVGSSALEDGGGVCYALIYSRDGGRTWRHARDHARARPGELPSADRRVCDTGPGLESIDLPTTRERFPAGSYLLRIEAFDEHRRLHYSYHQRRIEITR